MHLTAPPRFSGVGGIQLIHNIKGNNKEELYLSLETKMFFDAKRSDNELKIKIFDKVNNLIHQHI